MRARRQDAELRIVLRLAAPTVVPSPPGGRFEHAHPGDSGTWKSSLSPPCVGSRDSSEGPATEIATEMLWGEACIALILALRHCCLLPSILLSYCSSYSYPYDHCNYDCYDYAISLHSVFRGLQSTFKGQCSG